MYHNVFHEKYLATKKAYSELIFSVLTDSIFYATIPFAINARGNVVGFLSKSSQDVKL